MTIRYQAIAVDEPGTFDLGLDGAPVPPHHLVAVAEVEEHVEDGATMLIALPRVIAILDTGIPLDENTPRPGRAARRPRLETDGGRRRLPRRGPARGHSR
ncbi:unnamed protein product [[Actinomadura] parvosata subsp. kistnae]|uniref:hypothetical protein n=1 Tax=[Actinomadura] parvosata TaxID=1955412 RepID=UPI000D285BAC|nr:hypothetical protein [Nonomuraea sp. ATCC 55076]SPL98320.1 unnamed protein product [Actinomadura parvosata subsp. kistnae]